MQMNEEPRKPKTDKPSQSESLPPPVLAGEPFWPAVHVVKKGDTLASIARQYGTTAAKLKKLNDLTGEQAGRLKPGQKIKLK
ncbi:MAG: LysM peptidoglycan-binding domain-containing protein [Lentisphaeria bacterium]|nr:LysM peptidoglycan-binding domain-containing protein [Lentisphaeria bacterium]